MFRRRIYLTFLSAMILLLTGLNARAQKISIAIKLGGGLAYQHIDNPDVLSVTTVSSFSFGGLATYGLPYNFELQGGLNIARKGAIIVEDAITTTQRVTTVDIPINLVKKIDAGGLGSVYFGGGLYVSSAVGGNVYYETPGSATSDKLSFGNDLDLKRYDAGLNLTAGVKLNNHLLFDISYQYGLKNLASTRLTDTGTDGVKSRMFIISLGYSFR